MLERIDYIVVRIAGDYAYLQRKDEVDIEEKCVARALLPIDIFEGCNLAYENLSYEIC